MKNLLQGVVKDHRIPSDYKNNFTQPARSGLFLKELKRSFLTRMITKNYCTLPLFGLFGIMVPFFCLQSLNKLLTTGSLPQTLQPMYYLYRNSLGLYGHQHNMNSNPDNFYDRMRNCWTSDPNCGLDVGPKRPWIDLKDPTKNLMKFRREADDNIHIKANGWRGF